MTEEEKPAGNANANADADANANADAKASAADEDSDDIVFDTLWGRVLDAWEDDAPHNAALDYALRAQKLPELAGRYRALKDDREKGERAAKRLNAIVVAATQMLMSTKTPKMTKTPASITWTVFALCAVAIGWVAYAILTRNR